MIFGNVSTMYNISTSPNVANIFIYSCFGSIYLCESTFLYLKLTRTKCSVLVDSHTEDSLELSLSGQDIIMSL